MENTARGKIIKGVGGLYTVRVLDESHELCGATVQCRAKGAFRHSGMTPLAGDDVTLLFEADSSSVISEIEERRNSLIRPPLANLDYIFVTMAAAQPTPILTTVDKLTAIAVHNNIVPVIVITKADIAPDEAEKYADIYRRSGFSVFVISSVTGYGVDELKGFVDTALPSKTAAFAGASGVGKSTLMNALFPHLSLVTSEISRKIERGRHTTREVELFGLSEGLDCGYLADTPGFSMLDFERFDFFSLEELPLAFPELEERIGQCRYTKCTHTKEEGCAIVEAVKRGDIPRSRHDSFLELYTTLKAKKKW